GDRLAALAGDLRNDAIRALLAGGVIDHDRCPRGPQGLRDPCADSLRGPGDDGNLARKCIHGNILPWLRSRPWSRTLRPAQIRRICRLQRREHRRCLSMTGASSAMSDPTDAYPRSIACSVRTGAVRDLIGREAESELIATVVDRLPAGGGALLLRGEPGIGKSALLRLARERAEAAGSRTLTTVGVESEAEFAFAGLHQLLHPVLGHAA